MGVRDNRQLEVQLLAEWWASLPFGWPNKTNVNVGAITSELQRAGFIASQATRVRRLE